MSVKKPTRFPGFGLRLTWWGGIFLVVTLILALAAVNTSNNTLMMIVGIALGSYAISGAWSRQILGVVEMAVKPPHEIWAGRVAVFQVELSNPSRWIPAYGLVVRDSSGRVVLVEEMLAPGTRRVHAVECILQERGRHTVGPWRLEVVMPLGFFVKSKVVAHGTEVLVYPRLLPSGMAPKREAKRRRSSLRYDGRGREGDVTQLRFWRDGDDRRQLHWKQTARQQRLIVVDRQREVEEPVIVVVDPWLPDPADAQLRRRFEHTVSAAATTVVDRLSAGAAVGLTVGGITLAPVVGMSRAARLLTVLAEIQPTPAEVPHPANGGRDTWRGDRVDAGGAA
jgi:uncharacterized protein (DUF58 family)